MGIARAVKDVFVVAAKRTPFGTYGGKMANMSTTDMSEVAARAAMEAGKVKPDIINSVIMGNIFHATKDGAYLARHMMLRVGIPVATNAYAVNRMCGSGFQSIVNGCQEISCGDSEVVMTGGAENMSLSPFALRGIRHSGARLGQDLVLEDTLWQGLTDFHIKTPMGVTAENLAEKYNITRQQCDEFAVRSQATWKAANDGGYFKEEMAPVELKTKKGTTVVDTDEHPRVVTVEQIAKLAPVFKKDGTVSAANASGICDGAGIVILASEAALKKHNLTPLARISGYGVSGCDPHIMGIGPVPAIKLMLEKTGQKLEDMDLVEVNEAFAAQTLAVEKELGIDRSKLNVNGGAIALGHPVGASGSRITAHLVHELRRRGAKYAIGSACIGGGQGISLLIERV